MEHHGRLTIQSKEELWKKFRIGVKPSVAILDLSAVTSVIGGASEIEQHNRTSLLDIEEMHTI